MNSNDRCLGNYDFIHNDRETDEQSSHGKFYRTFCLSKYTGIVLAASQGLLFAITQILTKETISEHDAAHLYSIKLLTLRSLIEMFICVVLLLLFHRRMGCITGNNQERILNLFNGLFFTGTQILVHKALVNITPFEVTTILKSNIFTALLAWCALREKIRIIDISLILFSIGGCALISITEFINGKQNIYNNGSFYSIIGLVQALFASFFLSCCATVNRKITSTNFVFVNLVQSTIAIVICSIYLTIFLGNWFSFRKQDVIISFFCAVLSLGGHFCYVRSLQIEKASIVGVATSSEIPAIFILQSVTTKTLPSVSKLLGSCIIFSTLLIMPFRDYISNKVSNVITFFR